MLARMSQSWSDFPVVDVAPDLATHERLEDVTWSLFVAWTAGPDWVVATPDRVEREPVVRSSAEADDGTIDYWEVPFSAQDQDEIDDHLDSELSMAGLPPRPRGYDWYLRLDMAQRSVFGDRYGPYIEEGLGDGESVREYIRHIHKRMSDLVPEALEYATRPSNTAH
ncbi:DUF5956 family protein [Aeromicrobium chenweiae]|uniref:Uncharacterized protein n=1 Tax=Aeromicrobium chenweiae TaxID=2079793 RepID=A0A2S0WLJ6_9ACTN|nr:DUF5956 family protein [Aeromicrobium chenweiae]AWB92144.1 hypothetical protein C3E78_07995 [Aeromicrobium chenweiae]TGN32995.1 hypothetical protein E4L97_09970 [Aeromicrobium chenweiae]